MLKTIAFVTKQGDAGIPMDTVIDQFKAAESLQEIKDIVTNAEDRMFAAWASVDMVDRDNEVVPIDQIITQQDTLLARGGTITIDHSNRVVGRTHAYKIMRHPLNQALGILHLDEIYSDNEQDDAIWEEIRTGKRQGISVGGFNLNDVQELRDGMPVTVRDKFRQNETSTVERPSNPLALTEAISVVAKSAKDVKKIPSNVTKQSEYGPHTHDEANPAGIHSHPELQTQIDSLTKVNGLTKNTAQSADTLEVESTKKNTEEFNMDEEVKKEFETLTKKIASIADTIKASASKEAGDEEMPKEKEAAIKKQDEDEDKKKTEETDDMEKKGTKKDGSEQAAGDIAGEQGKETPDSPEPDQPNDEDVFKAQLKKQQDKIEALEKKLETQPVAVTKSQTPRPSTPPKVEATQVNKMGELANLGVDIAMGKKSMTINECHKMAQDIEKEKTNAIMASLQ